MWSVDPENFQGERWVSNLAGHFIRQIGGAVSAKGRGSSFVFWCCIPRPVSRGDLWTSLLLWTSMGSRSFVHYSFALVSSLLSNRWWRFWSLTLISSIPLPQLLRSSLSQRSGRVIFTSRTPLVTPSVSDVNSIWRVFHGRKLLFGTFL